MMHKGWSSIEEVPFCFSRSAVKFQGHIALKIVEFDPNLNSPMAMKCCTKLETAKKRCPIVNQGHPSNFKVTRDKTSPILTQIGRFRTIGRSQLSNPSDLPCFHRISSIFVDKSLSTMTWPYLQRNSSLDEAEIWWENSLWDSPGPLPLMRTDWLCPLRELFDFWQHPDEYQLWYYQISQQGTCIYWCLVFQ